MKFTSSAPRKKASASSKQEWVPQPHQQKALNLLTSVANGGLFLDPGMGKTSIILEAFRRFKEQGQVDKLIVLAPLRVASVAWPGELSKWSNFQDLTSTLVWGSKKDRRLEDDVDIYLINHEFLNTRSVANLPPLRGQDELSVGRQPDCDLVVNHASVSKRHAVLRWNDARLSATVQDLGSTNGTFLNAGARLTKETPVNDSDIISFGEVQFWFLLTKTLHAKLTPGGGSKVPRGL